MKTLAVLLCLAAGPAFATGSVTSVPAAVADHPHFRKVMIVILENTDYEKAMAQPYLAKLAERGALLTNYHAVTHPSQPNYIALVAGDALGNTDDERVDFPAKTRHLGDLLEAKKKTWAVYAEGYPGGCDARMHIGRYARKHQPFMDFKSVSHRWFRCRRHSKAAEALDADFKAGRLPDYSLFVPDLDDDGHDTGPEFASRWLEKSFGPRLDDPAFMKDMLVVVTFDEDGGTQDNRVYAVLLGPGVKAGAVSGARYSHYSLLKTVETELGLGDMGRNDAAVAPIRGVWEDGR